MSDNKEIKKANKSAGRFNRSFQRGIHKMNNAVSQTDRELGRNAFSGFWSVFVGLLFLMIIAALVYIIIFKTSDANSVFTWIKETANNIGNAIMKFLKDIVDNIQNLPKLENGTNGIEIKGGQ